MKTIQCSILSALCILLGSVANAELRTWTDSRGNTIEAELLENMHGNITLMRDNGEEAHISISDLSADDQKFVLVNTPPKIEIQVSEVTSRKNKGFSFENPNNSAYDRDVQVQTSSSHYKVTLKKSSTIPYHKPIQAELYVIGFKKQTDEYVLLSKTIEKVDFDQENSGKEFVFNSEQTTTKNLQGGREAGTKYHGNLVVLVDEKGRVFNAKGSRSRMEEHTAFIRKQKAGVTVTKADLATAQNILQQ